MRIERTVEPIIVERLADSAAVLLLGPRQVGKTTLARDIADEWAAGAVYLDLENPAHRRRLADPGAYLRTQAPRLVVIDEAQRDPALFEVLRGVIDDNRRAGHRSGQFLLLGSASLDLVGSTESLAGRVSHLELTGVRIDEAASAGIDVDQLWLRGGYPDSLLTATDAASLTWRMDIVRSYLERDVPLFAPRIPSETLRRLWTMVAHTSGSLLNASSLAQALAINGQTVDRYLDPRRPAPRATPAIVARQHRQTRHEDASRPSTTCSATRSPVTATRASRSRTSSPPRAPTFARTTTARQGATRSISYSDEAAAPRSRSR
nr:AAA family ATPase [Microbacterium sp. 18062]